MTSIHTPAARRAPLRATALALTLLFAVTACSAGGGSDDGASSDATTTSADKTTSDPSTTDDTAVLDSEVPDLCTLFTTDDFEELTGEAAGEPDSQPEAGAIRGSCTTSAEAGFPLVMVAAYNESDRQATLDLVGAEEVDDLGQEAYWDDTVGLVIPLEGKDWYLQVLATDGGADLDTSVAVAKVALERLGS